MPLFLVTMLTCALAGFACQAAARESTPTTSPPSVSVEVVTQDLAVGDSRLALVVLADGRPLSEGAVHLVFYYLQDPQPVVRAEADAVPRLDQHEHANLADHVDLPFYVAPVRFDRAGPWGMEAQVNQPGSATRVARTRLDVREQPLAPAIGSPAPRSASKTLRTAPPEELSSAVPIDPELYGLSIAEAIETGQPLVVNSTVDDTRYNNSNGAEPVQAVAAAEVYLDTPPWSPGAAPVALAAVDGTFDETIEPVTATLSTAGWPVGRHTLFVRGRDAAGNWGPVSAVFVDVIVPVELQEFTVE